MEEDSNRDLTSRSWLLLRPPQALMSLPVEYRWEFTRRHPYYLSYWKAAAKYRTNPSDDPAHRLFEQIAVQILGGIGIARSEQPIDPKLGAEALVLCPA